MFIDANGGLETACKPAEAGLALLGDGARATIWAETPAAVFARISSAGAACRLKPADLRRVAP